MDGEARILSRPLCVLVAEDEPLLALVVEEALVEEGHAVALAPDGQAALEAAAERGPFDVLLTDLRMPRLAGEELVWRRPEAACWPQDRPGPRTEPRAAGSSCGEETRTEHGNGA